MPQKHINTPTKTSPLKPVRKMLKEATDTSRLFMNVDELMRRSQVIPLTRYVE